MGTITKATLKARTAEKRRLGKTAMKKAGKGIFAPKNLSEDLAAICGKKTAPRTEVTKLVWAYIKKNSLNNGRVIKPDAALKKIFPVATIDMLKMPGYIGKHLA